MCDLFLVLAQTDEGVTCFALPRVLPDGARNEGFQLQRLKDKLGNRSNASSEVEFRGALAPDASASPAAACRRSSRWSTTRAWTASSATAAGMRAAVAQRDLARRPPQRVRQAPGRPAADGQRARRPRDRVRGGDRASPLRLARAYDEAPGDPSADAFKRLATAVAKYHVCKRAPGHAFEALECLGGNGYVEASGMPRLYREAPLASIWEGSGNVMALDVLRALARSPEALDAFFAEVDEAAGADPRLDDFAAATRAEFSDLEAIEPRARRVVERMALCLQGSLLVRHAPAAVADAFCAARLAGDAGLHYGTLPPGVDAAAIVARHTPPV